YAPRSMWRRSSCGRFTASLRAANLPEGVHGGTSETAIITVHKLAEHRGGRAGFRSDRSQRISGGNADRLALVFQGRGQGRDRVFAHRAELPQRFGGRFAHIGVPVLQEFGKRRNRVRGRRPNLSQRSGGIETDVRALVFEGGAEFRAGIL